MGQSFFGGLFGGKLFNRGTGHFRRHNYLILNWFSQNNGSRAGGVGAGGGNNGFVFQNGDIARVGVGFVLYRQQFTVAGHYIASRKQIAGDGDGAGAVTRFVDGDGIVGVGGNQGGVAAIGRAVFEGRVQFSRSCFGHVQAGGNGATRQRVGHVALHGSHLERAQRFRYGGGVDIAIADVIHQIAAGTDSHRLIGPFGVDKIERDGVAPGAIVLKQGAVEVEIAAPAFFDRREHQRFAIGHDTGGFFAVHVHRCGQFDGAFPGAFAAFFGHHQAVANLLGFAFFGQVFAHKIQVPTIGRDAWKAFVTRRIYGRSQVDGFAPAGPFPLATVDILAPKAHTFSGIIGEKEECVPVITDTWPTHYRGQSGIVAINGLDLHRRHPFPAGMAAGFKKAKKIDRRLIFNGHLIALCVDNRHFTGTIHKNPVAARLENQHPPIGTNRRGILRLVGQIKRVRQPLTYLPPTEGCGEKKETPPPAGMPDHH